MHMNTARDAMRRGLSPCSLPTCFSAENQERQQRQQGHLASMARERHEPTDGHAAVRLASPPCSSHGLFSKSRNTALSCLSSQR